MVQVTIDGLSEDAAELRLTALLDEYRHMREQRLSKESRRVQTASGLLICGLQQRLFSSIEAFLRTLRVHRRTVKRQWEAGQVGTAPVPSRADLISGGVGSDDDRSLLPEQELAAEEEAQVVAVSEATVGRTDTASSRELFERELKLLDEMEEIATVNSALPDGRVKALIEWIRQNMGRDLGTLGAKWNETRVIIFTEYDDTRRYLQQQLNAAVADSDDAEKRIAIFHGPTPPKDDARRSRPRSIPIRQRIRSAF